jgi:phosphoenolpyruvate carboxylase
MSTQHPDNVSNPFFVEDTAIGGEDEIQEAYYAFSHLGCDEQMWDYEGKDVDDFVVQKLLTKYDHYFIENRLGLEKFLTLRIPNPTVEKTDAKILIETLESIPRMFDTANLFYKEDIPPVLEVILPMTASAKCLNRVYYYYKDFVVGKGKMKFRNEEKTIEDWIGTFKPKEIGVIPLIEEKSKLLEADKIVEDFIRDKHFEQQRVFLARSDPALNYGFVSAVLLNKIALQKLDDTAERYSIDIFPILGVGSAPFRGNLRPDNWEGIVRNYPSVQTFTIQSAFKYDHPAKEVAAAIDGLSSSKRSDAVHCQEDIAISIIEKSSRQYVQAISEIAHLVNRLSEFVPARRRRKLHIGLFGYSRNMEGIRLPRAITFCSCLYAIGLPPELIGLSCLSEKDLDFLRKVDCTFNEDLADAARYYNPSVAKIIPANVMKMIRTDIVDYETDEAHMKLTSDAVDAIAHGRFEELRRLLMEAAWTRRFLG